jgi:hypothetical protein
MVCGVIGIKRDGVVVKGSVLHLLNKTLTQVEHKVKHDTKEKEEKEERAYSPQAAPFGLFV